MEPDSETLDLRGLKCPLPALFTRRRLKEAKAGTTLIVFADDPMAAIDVPHMCRDEGFEVLEIQREGEAVRIRLRRP